MTSGRRLAWLIAAVYVVGLALLVLTPIGGFLNDITVRLYDVWVYDLRWSPRITPPYFGAGLNVLMFIPLGVLVVLLVRWPWWAVTLLAVWTSAGIELVQVLPVLHRVASLVDVITNSVGGFVGAIGATLVLARHRARDAQPAAGSLQERRSSTRSSRKGPTGDQPSRSS